MVVHMRDAVRFLILHHLRASQYSGDWTDSAVRRFGRETVLRRIAEVVAPGGIRSYEILDVKYV